MTKQQTINELRLVIRQQNLYDDDQLDDRLIGDWVINERSVWIRNEANKNRSIDEQIIQTLGCVPLEVADRTSCPAYITGYHILQTNQDLPKTIELKNGDGLLEVGPVDKIAYPFSYVNLERQRFSGNGKWNRNIIYAARHGQRILVMSKGDQSFYKYLRYLRIRGLFEDPEEVANFTHVDGSACYSDTDDFPLNRWMWKYMREEILRVNFKELVAAPTDKVNDASENLKVATDGSK
jgi:hypothetical protein